MKPNTSSYIGGFVLGEPITNNAISTVVSSSNPRFKAGDIVIGNSSFSEYVIVPKARADKEETAGGFSVLSNPLDLDPKIFLGALGMPGLTAYSSFYEIGKPKKGEVIFISAASGAVGQIVGQLAKREGMVVIGSVGSDAKLELIKDKLGFDGGFNYKTEKPEEALRRVLKQLGKEGVDVYYDNVGGEQLDAALAVMNNWGRVGTYFTLLIFSYPSLSDFDYGMTANKANSLLRQRLPDLQKAGRHPRHQEHAPSSWQTSHPPRLHCLRSRLRTEVLGGASEEYAALD